MKFKRTLSTVLTTVLLILLQIVTVMPVKAQNAPGGMRIGMNVEGPNYYSSDGAYIDLIETAGKWGVSWGTATYQANGYPATCAGGVFSLVENFGYPAGAYQFYGQGSCDIKMDASTINPNQSSIVQINGQSYTGFVPNSVQVSYVVNGGQTNRIVTGLVQLNEPQQVNGSWSGSVPKSPAMLIRASNIKPSDPPNFYHLIRPDYPAWPQTQNAPGYPFGKEYLAGLAPFCALRFVTFAFSSNITDWNTRPDPTLYGNDAASFEKMIDLCNATNCDAWINIPITATQDFDINFAKMVKGRLNSNLHCHWEVGLECWNWAFPYWTDTNICYQMALGNTALPPGMPPLIPTGVWEMQGEAYAAVTMSHAVNIQKVLGFQGRPMICGQFVLINFEAGAMKYITQAMKLDPSSPLFPYGIAGAPYFSWKSTDSTLDDVFQSITNYLNTTIATSLAQQMALSKQYGIPFCCYEFGQSAFPTQANFDFNQSAQTDPRMGLAIQQEMLMLKNAGADLCTYFDYCRVDGTYGYWGSMQCIQQVNNPTPKYASVAAFAATCNCGNGAPTLPPSPPSLPPSPPSLPPSAPSPPGPPSAPVTLRPSAGNGGNHNPNPILTPRMGGGSGSSGGNSSVNPGGVPWMH